MAEARRIGTDALEFAKQADLASLVTRHVKLIRKGGALWGCCPFHKEKTPSFKVERGRYKCFGCDVSGDAIQYVRETERLGFADAVERLSGMRVVAQTEKPEQRKSSAKTRRARAIWQSASPAAGSPLERYFEARRLPWPPPDTIRFHPDFVWSRAGLMTLPAMIVAIYDMGGEIVGVEATALSRDCTRKAFANSRHKEGELGAGAVHLGEPSAVLGLAEGAETAIAAQYLSAVPTWACLGAARMQAVAVPDSVRELHLFGDDDPAGREAIERTIAAHPKLKRIVRLPPLGCKDWNDVLITRGEGAIVDVPEIDA